MLFAKLGAVARSFDYSLQRVNSKFVGGSETLYGGIFGIGSETSLGENIFLRTDFDYSMYADKTIQNNTGDTKVDMDNHEFSTMVSIGYRF